jgi:hypothetical protein
MAQVSIENFVTDIGRDQFRAVYGDLDECDRLLKETHLGFGLLNWTAASKK